MAICNVVSQQHAGTGAKTDIIALLMQLITHSSSLPYMVPALVLSLLCYNIAGMFVTDEIGAVARTVLETMRTLFVWMVDLLLYYTPLGLGRLGEKWDNYSYLQAVGYAASPCLPVRKNAFLWDSGIRAILCDSSFHDVFLRFALVCEIFGCWFRALCDDAQCVCLPDHVECFVPSTMGLCTSLGCGSCTRL